jgi:hypothetical protein
MHLNLLVAFKRVVRYTLKTLGDAGRIDSNFSLKRLFYYVELRFALTSQNSELIVLYECIRSTILFFPEK